MRRFIVLNKWCGTYKLNPDKTITPCSTLEWSEQLESMMANDTKHVAKDDVNDCWISTVWLGLDHQYIDDGPPHIYETMIKKTGDGWLNYQERYSTWDEAVEGHKRAVEWVKNGCKEEDL